MNNNTQHATQALGAEQLKPFLLFNDEIKADAYIRKINTFKNEVEKFKPQFESIVTKNLTVTFSKKWLKIIVDGDLEVKINEALASYLERQPRMLQSTIYKEFEGLANDLYKSARIIKSNFDQSINVEFCPNGLEKFEGLPINESGSFEITPQWETQARKQFEQYVTTPQHFERYNAIQACLKAQDNFKTIYGSFAPYVWQGLNSNGFITSAEINNSHINALVKW